MKLNTFFLFLILLLSTRIMNLSFFSDFPYDIVNLSVSFYFIVYSFLSRNSVSIKQFKNTIFFTKFFFLAFIFSTITAYIDWNQSFFISFIASRSVLWLAFGFYLIKSETKAFVLIEAFKKFAWLYVILSLMVYIFPSIKSQFIYLDKKHAYMLEDAFFAGIQLIIIPLYIILDKIFAAKKIYKLELILLILIIVSIIISNNRATLFPLIVLIFGAFIFFSRFSVLQNLIIVISSFVLFTFFVWDKVGPLLRETQEQITDNNYPRLRGIFYFLGKFSKSELGFVLGNSVGSSKVSYGRFMDTLKIMGIYISDLGLFGTWVMFGSLSLIAILFPVVKIIRSPKEFMSFKLMVFHLLLGSTMFTFLPEYTFVFFISILYLFDLNLLETQLK